MSLMFFDNEGQSEQYSGNTEDSTNSRKKPCTVMLSNFNVNKDQMLLLSDLWLANKSGSLFTKCVGGMSTAEDKLNKKVITF